ncbi:MAG: alpha/beta fold hydrolase [Patescibacteria group bacterium]|nr:alpha/beta fold hydrolase [Patescibacteria group bacterium]
MSTRIPVVIAPGFFTSASPVSIPIVEKLRDKGYKVVSPGPSLMSFLPIHFQAVALSKLVNEALKKYQAKKCNVIGISMGGIATLYYLRELGGAEKVNAFIAIGTPFKGTNAGFLGVFFASSTWEILPNSRLLRHLMSKPKPQGVAIYTFIGAKDRVSPPNTSRYKDTRCKIFPGGHADICLGLDNDVVRFIDVVFTIESPQ